MDDVHMLFINSSLKRRYHVDLWNATPKVLKTSDLTKSQPQQSQYLQAQNYPNNHKNDLHHSLFPPVPDKKNLDLGSGEGNGSQGHDYSNTGLISKKEESESNISTLNFHKNYEISKEHVSCWPDLKQSHITLAQTGQSDMDHHSQDTLQFHSLNPQKNHSQSLINLNKGSCPDCAAGKSGHIRHIGRWRMIDSSE